MNLTIQALLGLSVCLNAFFISLGVWIILKRGGLPYWIMRVPLLKKLGNQGVQGASFNFPYYNHRQSQLKLLPIQASDIVFLGDSITDEGEWAELCGNPTIKNRGLASDTTIGVLDRLHAIIAPQPQKIFLMIGVNDLSNLGRLPTEISQTYKEILTQIRERSPQTNVFIQSVLPINRTLFLGFTSNNDIQALNAQLQHLATEFPYPYIDLHSHFLDSSNQLDTQYTSDGIHLNGIAYQHWQTLIKPYVLS